jgi:hypothetical protein
MDAAKIPVRHVDGKSRSVVQAGSLTPELKMSIRP